MRNLEEILWEGIRRIEAEAVGNYRGARILGESWAIICKKSSAREILEQCGTYDERKRVAEASMQKDENR